MRSDCGSLLRIISCKHAMCMGSACPDYVPPSCKHDAAQSFTFPAYDPGEEGTLEEGLDAALELHNREETLLARAEKAEQERDEVKAQLDAERKKIRELLPGFIPHLDMDCEDCEEERSHKCADCEFLFDVIATIEPLPPAPPPTPEKKYGYAAVLRQRDEAEAACAETRGAIRKVLDYFNGIDRCLHLRYELKETSGGVWSYQYLQDTLQAALSSFCGKAMLARVKHLEQAEGLLRQIVSLPVQGKADEFIPDDKSEAYEMGYGDAVTDGLNNSLAPIKEAIDAYLNPKLPAAPDIADSDDQGDADDDPGSDEPEAPEPVENEPKEGESRA